MARLRWSTQALAELDQIETFLARTSPAYARAFVTGVFAGVRRLEPFPRSGRVVPELYDEAVRELLHRGYRIVYHVDADDECAEIVTLFHSSQPFGTPLGDSG